MNTETHTDTFSSFDMPPPLCTGNEIPERERERDQNAKRTKKRSCTAEVFTRWETIEKKSWGRERERERSAPRIAPTRNSEERANQRVRKERAPKKDVQRGVPPLDKADKRIDGSVGEDVKRLKDRGRS